MAGAHMRGFFIFLGGSNVVNVRKREFDGQINGNL